jgi:undecaprenyl-diphosphatase
MDILKTIILAIVQGITEFLPVSSSGHLVLFGRYIEAKGDPLLMSVFLHFGTLIAVVAVYWNDIWRVLLKDRMVIVYLIIATIPAIIAGLLFEDWFEEKFAQPNLIGYFFIITALVLFIGHIADKRISQKKPIGWSRSLIIGLAQALAILPGVSRSGSTISAGLICGLDRDKSARFAFFMAIPAIGGGLLLELKDSVAHGTVGEISAVYFIGMAIAGIIGYVALRLFLAVLHRGNFIWFSLYCFLLGIYAIIFVR